MRTLLAIVLMGMAGTGWAEEAIRLDNVFFIGNDSAWNNIVRYPIDTLILENVVILSKDKHGDLVRMRKPVWVSLPGGDGYYEYRF